jgi:hypothetical protein
MDNLLNQMIAFDDQAARLVKNAEAQATGILETARREAEALEKKLEAECQAEIDALIRTRTDAAEKVFVQEQEAEETRLREENKRLMEQVPGLARSIAEVLAYPSSAVR